MKTQILFSILVIISSFSFGQNNLINVSETENKIQELIANKHHLIILSPHLDDGVWSCGGLISHATKSGCKVDVITVYTGNPVEKDLPKLQEKEITKHGSLERRKEEDTEALTILNANIIWWDFPTRLLRKPWINKRTETFNTPIGDIMINDSNYLKIENKIKDLITNNPDAYIFSPISVGHMYDHVELFTACINMGYKLNYLEKILFYEDGYGFITKNRKKHFLLKNYIWERKNAPENTSIMWSIMGKVMANSTSDSDFRTYIPKQVQYADWSVDVLNIENEFEIKMKSLSKYDSQISQFGGMKKVRKLFERYHNYWNNGEPYWYIKTFK